MHNFRELKIWQEAMQITRTHLLTRDFPERQKYGLTSQITRAALSIPSNIAEGAERSGNKEFCNFLNISMGSCFELETPLISASDFGYLKKDDFDSRILNLNKLEKMIHF